MKRLVAVTLLLLGSLFALPISTHPAHGQVTGVVCLTRATSTNCPQVPLTFNATGGSTFTIGVFIQGSDAMGGFDIYVQSDNTLLNPVSAALGTLIASPSLISICVNGISQTGACTTPSPNGPGVVEVTTIESTGGNECGGIAPCSGMAFTITYQVMGTTSGTPLSYPIHPACAQSSVSSPPNVCVQVTEAFGTNLSETTLAGDFSNQTPSANFVATPTSGLAPLTVNFDASLSNATTGNTITFYNWAFGDGLIANVTTATTSHVYVAAGSYHPNLETADASGKSSPNSPKDGLTITVLQPDFSIVANTTSLTIPGGKNRNATITLTSTDGFAGVVSLSANSSGTLGITSTLNHATVTLTSGQTDSSTMLTVAVAVSTPSGSYTINVTGTSGTLKHSTFITIIVVGVDFLISANPQSLTVPEGGNGNSIITFTSQSGFSGVITLTSNPNSSSIVAFLNRTSVSVTAGGNSSSTLYIIAMNSTAPGPYKVTVTGTSGSLTHSFNVIIDVPVPNFGVSPTPTSLSVKTGTNGTSVITLIGVNGFTGNISLEAKAPPSVGITPTFSDATVMITSTSGPVSSTLTISTTATTPAGTYTITVNGTSTTLQHLVNITLTVVSPLPTVQVGAATLSVVSATAGNTVDMTVTISNTGTIPVNITVTMDVNSGTGNNITVAQQTLTLNPGQASQTFTLRWNTTQWSSGNYHVYARVIGSQTNTVNQAQSAGTLALSSPPAPPVPANLSVIPWVTTGIASVVAVLLGLLLFRRRRPTQSV